MTRVARAALLALFLTALSARAETPDNELTVAKRAEQLCAWAKQPRLTPDEASQLHAALVRVELFYHLAHLAQLKQALIGLGCDPAKPPSLALFAELFGHAPPPKGAVKTPALQVPPSPKIAAAAKPAARPAPSAAAPAPAAGPAPAAAQKAPLAHESAQAVLARIAKGKSEIQLSEFTRSESDEALQNTEIERALAERDRERKHPFLQLPGFGQRALGLLGELAAGRDGWGAKLLVELEHELHARGLRLVLRPLPPVDGKRVVFKSFMGQQENSFCFAQAVGPNKDDALLKGRGTNVAVSLDVNLYETHPFRYVFQGKDGKDWAESPLHVALGHELIHAFHMVTGNLLAERRGDDFQTDEEAFTISGVKEVRGPKPALPPSPVLPAGEVTENRLLAERGLPLRLDHSGGLPLQVREKPNLLPVRALEDPAEVASRKIAAELEARLAANKLSPPESKVNALVKKVAQGLADKLADAERRKLIDEVQAAVEKLNNEEEYPLLWRLILASKLDEAKVRLVFGDLTPGMQ